MNASEGLRRIAAVVRWVGAGFAGLSLLLALGYSVNEVYSHFSCDPQPWLGDAGRCKNRLGDAMGAALVGAGVAAFFHYGARATAWIIDGFAAPRA